MRFFLLLNFLFCYKFASAQPYFARFYTFPDKTANGIRSMHLYGDTVLFRMNSDNIDVNTLETRLVTMATQSKRFGQNVYLPNTEGGASLIKDSAFYILPSEDKIESRYISVNRLDKDFRFVDSVHLKFRQSPYYYYVGDAIMYNNKYVITARAQNTNTTSRVNTAIFILNRDLSVHSTLMIDPVRNFIKLQQASINPVDKKLYFSLIYDDFNLANPTFPIPPKYQKIITIDSNFQLKDFWVSKEEISVIAQAAPITFSKTGTLYTSYSHVAFDYILAIDSVGDEMWKTPLDTFMMVGSTTLWLTSRIHVIFNLTTASNNDILVAGYIDETKYNIGQSSFLSRVRPDGTIKWTRVYRSNDLFSLQSFGYASLFGQVIELPNRDIMAGGDILLLNQLAPNVPATIAPWLVHADSNGCISPACAYVQDAVQKPNYLPIVHPSNEWTVEHTGFSIKSRRRFRFLPDSILINGKYYHELAYDDTFFGTQSTGKYYREEQGIVYSHTGTILYDMNLESTDTLASNNFTRQGTRRVVAVKTVVLDDGLPRKSMTVRCENDSTAPFVTVIEGIGDIKDFFYSETQCINPLDGPSNEILCYSVNGNVVYLKQGANCDLSSIDHDVKQGKIKVYPNPAKDHLYILIPAEEGSATYQIRIYNTLGAPMGTQQVALVSRLLDADVSTLPPGNYWGVISSDNGRYFPFSFGKLW